MAKKSSIYRLNWDTLCKCSLIVFLIVFLILAMLLSSEAHGESSSFMLSTLALSEHGSLQVTEDDYVKACRIFPEHANIFDWYYHDFMPEDTEGNRYPWYFGIYAPLCVPILKLLMQFKFDASYAFSITNALWLSFSLWCVYRFANIDAKKKLLVIFFLGCSPIVRYIEWQSYEAVTYSFVVIATTFWLSRKRNLAALFVSLAGTMNPTIMFWGAMMIVDFFAELFLQSGKNLKRFFSNCWVQRKEIILYGLCFVPCLIPFIITYLHLGSFNAIATLGVVSTNGIIDRTIAYLFDLNLGIFPYIPVMLVLFVITCIKAYSKGYHYMLYTLFGVIGTIFAYSLTIHINCGMAGMARYNVWLLPVIIMCVIFSISDVFSSRNGKIAVVWLSAFSIIWCFSIVAQTASSLHAGAYIYWTPLAETVLDNAPQLYDPLPSTFMSRTQHKDGCYDISEPVIYTNKEGYVRKMLVPAGMLDQSRQMLWISEKDEQHFEKECSKITGKNEAEYLNFGADTHIVPAGIPYEIGEKVDVVSGEPESVSDYFISGLSFDEGDYAWTDGNKVKFEALIENVTEDVEMQMEIKWIYGSEQRMIIRCNGHDIFSDTIYAGRSMVDFLIPADYIDNGRLVLDIEYPDAVSPFEMDQSNDSRVLAIAIMSFEMNYAEEDMEMAA